MLREHITELYKQTTLDGAWGQFLEILGRYGIDRAIYGYTDMATAHNIGSALDALVLSNLPQRYLDFYLLPTTYQNSPMTKWAETSTGSCSWSRIPELIAQQGSDAKAMEIVAENQRFGITTGYTIAFPQIGKRSKGAGALIAMNGTSQQQLDSIWSKHGKDLELVFQTLHHMVHVLPHDMGRANPLSSKQLEILEYKADGKTTTDISRLLSVSSRAVEKHLAAARNTLGAETTAHAVQLIASRNLFFQSGAGPSWE